MNKFVYRPEIDGLRAFAVIVVILFHAGFVSFSGGYIGVDVFFVISGYLITSIILEKKRRKEFTLLDFYQRRIRRILPALFFVVLFSLPFAWFWISVPKDLSNYGLSIIATSSFWSNFLFYNESGYFQTAAELKPLLHTWSLAIEEQFYIVFPVFILIFWRFGIKKLLTLLILIGLFSLIFAQIGGNLTFDYPYIEKNFFYFSQPVWANFFLPSGRIWELILGVLIAFYFSYKEQPKKFNQLLSLIGCVFILYSIFTFSQKTPYPSVYTLIPTFGTALIIIFTTNATILHKLLSQRHIVLIGLISYSAYLYHYPILAFAKYKSFQEPSDLLIATLCLLTFVFAYFSWKYIEKPFRNKNIISNKIVFISAPIAIFTLIALGYFVYSTKLPETKMNKILKKYEQINFNLESELSSERKKYKEFFKNGFSENIKTKKILIIGNSHAFDTFIVFNENRTIFPVYEFRYYIINLDKIIGNSKKDKFLVDNFIKSNLFKSADTIFLSTKYEFTSAGLKNDLKAIEELDIITKDKGKKLIISGNGPDFHTESNPVFDIVLKNKNEKLSNNEIEFLSYNILKKDILYKNKIIKEKAKELNLTYLDKFDYSCNFKDYTCKMLTDDGRMIYLDRAHLTIEGAKYLGQIIHQINWLKKNY